MPDTSQARRETFSQQEGGLAYPTKCPKCYRRREREGGGDCTDGESQRTSYPTRVSSRGSQGAVVSDPSRKICRRSTARRSVSCRSFSPVRPHSSDEFATATPSQAHPSRPSGMQGCQGGELFSIVTIRPLRRVVVSDTVVILAVGHRGCDVRCRGARHTKFHQIW